MLNGQAFEHTWKSGETLDPADVAERDLQYIYPEGTDFVFTDASSGEQVSVSGDKVGADSKWLSDGMTVGVTLFNGIAIGVSLPNPVVLQIVIYPIKRGHIKKRVVGKTLPQMLPDFGSHWQSVNEAGCNRFRYIQTPLGA